MQFIVNIPIVGYAQPIINGEDYDPPFEDADELREAILNNEVEINITKDDIVFFNASVDLRVDVGDPHFEYRFDQPSRLEVDEDG